MPGTDSHSAAEAAPLELRALAPGDDLTDFIRVPWPIYHDDPQWVPPLLMERRDHLSPRKNPYFRRAETCFWIAYRDGRAVGRISAQVNQVHLERYDDATGHFGFFEATDDPAVFRALTETAEAWLAERGMRRVTGPFSFSINEESGLLVEGFDSPPYIMMGHARPYYGPGLESCGYGKVADMVAYYYDRDMALPRTIERLIQRAESRDDLTVRVIDMKRYHDEVGIVIDIFNDAWSENWGFLPFSEIDGRHLADSIRPLITARNIVIAEIAGKPAAMSVILPNINRMIQDLDGRLLPFGWLKLVWRLKFQSWHSGRMPLMGVRKEYQGSSLGAALAFAVIRAHREYFFFERGVRESELSWVLEDNTATRHMVETLGARVNKVYRVYQKDLE